MAQDQPPASNAKRDLGIELRDCNSIDSAEISLRIGALNIKYGPNGIGKSTIARALTLQAQGAGALDQLTPFKHRHIEDGARPSVTGASEIKRVLMFNDEYVSQFVFLPDEVVKNSFEIFIDTEDYREGLQQIEKIFLQLKETFDEQKEFTDALSSFRELRDAFNLTKGGSVAKTSKGIKALIVGGKLQKVPEHLHGYSGFIESDDPAGWITWQSRGKSFLDLSDNCPFCATVGVDKETATQVSQEYETAAVRNMMVLRTAIEKLGMYFEPRYLEQLTELTTSITGVSPEKELFLVTLRGQIETLLRRLSSLEGLSFHVLRDEANVADVLAELKIDLGLLHALNSETTQTVVDLINKRLDEVAAQINSIRQRIGEQKTRVAKLIKLNQDAINDFLRSAGYRYTVRIEARDDSYRMLLEHQDAPGHLETAAAHLSYGEKNAFALVLFMHQVQRERPDLVVLDDPVSSFDKTKKFAILHQLFHGKNSLRNSTSLLLTHDIEPAIDIVRTGTSGQFTAAEPIVHFLSGRDGRVVEKPVAADDIATFSEVCDANIKSASDPLIKAIYLRRRFEIHGSRGLEYELLSSLLHVRVAPTRKGDGGEHIALTEAEILEATQGVREYIPAFDYAGVLDEIRGPGSLSMRFAQTDVGYEKVQIFRVMSVLDPVAMKGDDVFTKFVNETFHIENEYVMQLNPREFDAVPDFVVAACSKLVEEAAAK